MHKDSPLADREHVTFEDLLDKPLILPRRNLVQRQIVRWFGTQYKSLHVIATYNLIYNAAIMVKEGFGYAQALENMISRNASKALCYKPLEPPFEVGVVLARKKYQVFSAATKALRDHFNF